MILSIKFEGMFTSLSQHISYAVSKSGVIPPASKSILKLHGNDSSAFLQMFHMLFYPTL